MSTHPLLIDSSFPSGHCLGEVFADQPPAKIDGSQNGTEVYTVINLASQGALLLMADDPSVKERFIYVLPQSRRLYESVPPRYDAAYLVPGDKIHVIGLLPFVDPTKPRGRSMRIPEPRNWMYDSSYRVDEISQSITHHAALWCLQSIRPRISAIGVIIEAPTEFRPTQPIELASPAIAGIHQVAPTHFLHFNKSTTVKRGDIVKFEAVTISADEPYTPLVPKNTPVSPMLNDILKIKRWAIQSPVLITAIDILSHKQWEQSIMTTDSLEEPASLEDWLRTRRQLVAAAIYAEAYFQQEVATDNTMELEVSWSHKMHPPQCRFEYQHNTTLEHSSMALKKGASLRLVARGDGTKDAILHVCDVAEDGDKTYVTASVAHECVAALFEDSPPSATQKWEVSPFPFAQIAKALAFITDSKWRTLCSLMTAEDGPHARYEQIRKLILGQLGSPNVAGLMATMLVLDEASVEPGNDDMVMDTADAGTASGAGTAELAVVSTRRTSLAGCPKSPSRRSLPDTDAAAARVAKIEIVEAEDIDMPQQLVNAPIVHQAPAGMADFGGFAFNLADRPIFGQFPAMVLNEEQLHFLRMALCEKQTIVPIDAGAGTGKTRLLLTLANICHRQCSNDIRILVLANTNDSVDLIADSYMNSFYETHLPTEQPRVLRLTAKFGGTRRPEWQKYSLDARTEQLLNSGLLSEDDFGTANEYMTARKEYSAEISAKILESKKERRKTLTRRRQLRKLFRKNKNNMVELVVSYDKPNMVFSTVQAYLSSGMPSTYANIVILDEASMTELHAFLAVFASLSPSTLKSFILTGDLAQIGVFSLYAQNSHKTLLTTSILHSVTTALPASRIVTLRRNYRSAPSVIGPVNQLSYNGRLIPMLKEQQFATERGRLPLPLWQFGCYVLDVQGICTGAPGGSKANSAESAVINRLARVLIAHGIERKSICTMALYEKQRQAIQAQLADVPVLAKTVDSTQGSEWSTCLLSFTRTIDHHVTARDVTRSPQLVNQMFGFSVDPRRATVCLSRARSLFFLVGDCHTLSVAPYWRDVINSLRQRQAIITERWLQALEQRDPMVPVSARDYDAQGRLCDHTGLPYVIGFIPESIHPPPMVFQESGQPPAKRQRDDQLLPTISQTAVAAAAPRVARAEDEPAHDRRRPPPTEWARRNRYTFADAVRAQQQQPSTPQVPRPLRDVVYDIPVPPRQASGRQQASRSERGDRYGHRSTGRPSRHYGGRDDNPNRSGAASLPTVSRGSQVDDSTHGLPVSSSSASSVSNATTLSQIRQLLASLSEEDRAALLK